MGAGSRGEGGGEEEGGGIWAPAPFIAAARRAGVPCSRSHGGANSCYQQAPGRLQYRGRRHHPVASDSRGGDAGERRGRRPPRPKPGAQAWSGLRRARSRAALTTCGARALLGAAPAARAVPRLPPGLPRTGAGLGAWPGGEGRSRRGGLGGSQGRGAVGTGQRAELEPSGTGRGSPSGPLLPRALGGRAAHAGRTGSRRAGQPPIGGLGAVGCWLGLLALRRGCGSRPGPACGRGWRGRYCVAPGSFLQCNLSLHGFGSAGAAKHK